MLSIFGMGATILDRMRRNKLRIDNVRKEGWFETFISSTTAIPSHHGTAAGMDRIILLSISKHFHSVCMARRKSNFRHMAARKLIQFIFNQLQVNSLAFFQSSSTEISVFIKSLILNQVENAPLKSI